MDGGSAKEIDEIVEKLLKEIGASEPPISPETVISHLKLHKEYYSLTNPDLFNELAHQFNLTLNKVANLVKKLNLQALFFVNDRHILIDSAVPKPKMKWVTSHEIGHELVPWHKDFFYQDNPETLDPFYHEVLEQEANYAASSLIFMASRFTKEARDFKPSWDSVNRLSSIYGNSKTSTLRRFVEHAHQIPMVGLVSIPPWLTVEGAPSSPRHFVVSVKFSDKFSKTSPTFIWDQILPFLVKRRGGSVGSGEVILIDDNGEAHTFDVENFFNGYDVLSFIIYKGKVIKCF